MKHFRSKHFHITWIFLAALAAVLVIYINQRYQTPIQDFPKFDHTKIKSKTGATSTTSSLTLLPSSLNLKVPFTPQAPTGNWDQLHNESCEEASSIMAYAYFSGTTDVNLKPEFVEDQLSKITGWEKQEFGYYLDINAEETATLLKKFYGLNAKVITNYTADEFKKELAQNHLVLLLANGKLLNNPNFRQPGPPYHMLVLRGYTGDNFVTNDPGTRKGLNYIYTFQTLYNAGGDWSHNINAVDLGSKAAVVVWK